ncbi:DUF2231 domain-containing protein [Micromonospora rifamycinica]|uniref:Uncharacterized protein n=1 Tax=Micromonospora rifamycinica TaxID=291594 RepID=A0A109ILI2_9ACTN|nr:DUF2231 domain-containing protein [Micromonospora rifamycinica]KWV32653.1 hypothetical protein AWV63_11425 [Micromonospora rifamycinica]SCG63486.1 hypothetical protein GA0070623_2992 [Micromonospora rifamycinica]
MFKEFNGLPSHVLVVHAVVVFVPLLALLASAYGLVPRWRPRLDWAVAILAVVTPVLAWVATETGEEFQAALKAKGYSPELLAKIQEHSELGDILLWWTLALAVAALLLLAVTSDRVRTPKLPTWATWVLTGVVVVLSVLSCISVYLTGDSGAASVWTNTF